MLKPRIDIKPLWTAIASDRPTCLDVLVRITPPSIEGKEERPPLNLAVVIDRSGSMSGEKLKFAKEAACFLVDQLRQVDRIGVTVFDDQVETIVPNLPALNKPGIQEWIHRIQVGGSTALYGGWKEGGAQVLTHLQPGLNRVLLLSDGQANVGESNPDAIAGKVHRLLKKGVSTTTLGIGDDYNEDLMEAMARSGDGNYYFIEAADQLPAIFEAELCGLAATCGQRVSLGITPSSGIALLDVFNDFDRLPTDRLKLPNLMHGHSLFIVLRLQVPPMAGKAVELCEFRLAWDEPETGERHEEKVSLFLPSVPGHQIDEELPDPLVQEHLALLLASRARKEAIAAMDRGDDASCAEFLRHSADVLYDLACPASVEVQQELENMKMLTEEFKEGDRTQMRKRAMEQSYRRSRSKQ